MTEASVNPTSVNPADAKPTDLKSEILAPVHEPLLPIEKTLIAWSLGTGLVLLAILVLLTRVSWAG